MCVCVYIFSCLNSCVVSVVDVIAVSTVLARNVVPVVVCTGRSIVHSNNVVPVVVCTGRSIAHSNNVVPVVVRTGRRIAHSNNYVVPVVEHTGRSIVPSNNVVPVVVCTGRSIVHSNNVVPVVVHTGRSTVHRSSVVHVGEYTVLMFAQGLFVHGVVETIVLTTVSSRGVMTVVMNTGLGRCPEVQCDHCHGQHRSDQCRLNQEPCEDCGRVHRSRVCPVRNVRVALCKVEDFNEDGVTVYAIPPYNSRCRRCNAIHFQNEFSASPCCAGGRVQLPPLPSLDRTA